MSGAIVLKKPHVYKRPSKAVVRKPVKKATGSKKHKTFESDSEDEDDVL